MDRRKFLALAGGTGAALAMGGAQDALAAPQSFSFVFLTDAHIQPELDAAKGCAMAFKKIAGMKADFAIQGGDHIFDALGVPKSRALQLFDLYDKTEQEIGLKVHHTIGNHDVVGIYPKSGVEPTDPQYGKKLYADRFGKTYYSFDHKGVHFIVLDSIGITSDRAYEGRIDADQLVWLRADLAAIPQSMPVIITSHIPLVTSYEAYLPIPKEPAKHHGISVINSADVLDTFKANNVIGVFQGHTHINELVSWRGVPYMTSGAVSGNWWKGVHYGAAEGFTVVTVQNGKLSTRYETYGFQPVVRQDV